MAAYLSGEEEFQPVPHNIDSWRLGIMQFVLDYWKKLETQMMCPARTQDPNACFQCIDTRVIACIVENKANERLINIRRK